MDTAKPIARLTLKLRAGANPTRRLTARPTQALRKRARTTAVVQAAERLRTLTGHPLLGLCHGEHDLVRPLATDSCRVLSDRLMVDRSRADRRRAKWEFLRYRLTNTYTRACAAGGQAYDLLTGEPAGLVSEIQIKQACARLGRRP